MNPLNNALNLLETANPATLHGPPYPRDAYLFLIESVDFTLQQIQQHKTVTDSCKNLSPQEVLEGFRLYALKELGPLTLLVLDHWGITCCLDIGYLVFNLVEVGFFAKTLEDTLEAFQMGYEFETVFAQPYRLHCSCSHLSTQSPAS